MNSILNVCVLAMLVLASASWISSPGRPQPLPNDPRFVSQVQQSGAVLVKFGAKWCPPCRQIEAELDALARTSSTDVSVVKIDVEQNRALAAHYHVSSIPCLILFKDGKQVGKAIGYRDRDQLQTWIASSR